MGTWSEKILRRWNKYFGNLDNSYCTFLMINCSFNFFYQHLFDKNRKPLYIWHIFSNGNVFENGVCIYIYIYILLSHIYSLSIGLFFFRGVCGCLQRNIKVSWRQRSGCCQSLEGKLYHTFFDDIYAVQLESF